MDKNRSRGISLIVLVVTIVVIIILAGVVVLGLLNNNPITSASKAKFLSNVRGYETEFGLYLNEQYSKTLGKYDEETLQADSKSVTYKGQVIDDKTIYDLIPSLGSDTEYKDKFIVLDGELIFTGVGKDETSWLDTLGIKTSTAEPEIFFSDPTIELLGKQVKYKASFYSNYPLSKIVLDNNVKVVDESGTYITDQPAITIGGLTGTDLDKVRTVDITIDTSTLGQETYRLAIKAGAVKNSNDIFNTKDIISDSNFTADNIAPINPTMTATPTNWTNTSVSVSITYTEDSESREYSLDGTTWQTYASPIDVTENNTTVYSRAADTSGNQSGQSTLTVANIDKISPTVDFGTNGSSDIKEATTTVTLNDAGGSNIDSSTLQYVWDIQDVDQPEIGWNTFVNGQTLTKNSETGTYYLWIKGSDNAGNAVVAKSNAFGLDNTAPINPSMVASPTSWTNGNVTVTITYPSDAVVKEYSTNGTTWSTYTTPVIVGTNNTTVYAKATDAAGNQSGQSTLTVANIDKVVPIVTAGNGGVTTSSVTVTATASDAGGSGLNSSSYQYSKDNGVTWTSATNATSYTYTALATGTYQCKVKVIDNAGNTTVSNSVSLPTTAVGTISMVANPTGWTNGNVTVTCNYPSEIVTKQYSLDGSNWNTYSSALTITANGTVYARGYDAGNNQTMQATITITNIDKTAPVISNALAGSIIYTDPTFQSGINSTVVYNNSANGMVTNTRVAISGAPTGSGYGLEVRTTGSASPGWGGFYFATPSAANKVFITKIVAKIPAGYNINFASNLYGDGGTAVWLTSQAGTGNWAEYECKVTCGPTGTFNTTNFFFLSDGVTPTSASPLVWQVAYATVFDTTKWDMSNSIVANATDTSGIVGYGINQSSSVAPTFTSCAANTKFATAFDNITANGTYYVWVKDQAGNVANAPVAVNYVDRTGPSITNALAGSSVYADPTFQSGINSTYTYNNLGNGNVSNTRVAISGAPVGSGYGLEIRTTGTASPGWGGFFFGTQSAANKVFITKIVAKIPVGYNIYWGSNAIGNGGNNVWLTSQAGTGNWAEYICKTTCGPDGSFSTTNFYYISEGVAPTPASPLVWQVAYATVFDTTRADSPNSIMASATDLSGVVGYGINQSSSVAPAFTGCPATTTFAKLFDNITSNGTYYVWLKDQAGNITNAPANVSYVQLQPTVGVYTSNYGSLGSINIVKPASSSTPTVLSVRGVGQGLSAGIIINNLNIKVGDTISVTYSVTRSINSWYIDLVDSQHASGQLLEYNCSYSNNGVVRTNTFAAVSNASSYYVYIVKSDYTPEDIYGTMYIHDIKINGVKVL